MRYAYAKPIFIKIERIVGFLLLAIGIFAVLKLLHILDETYIIPSQYLAWFTAIICIFFGFILLAHKQHGIS